MPHYKLNDISIDKINLNNDVITECLADLSNNDKNLSKKSMLLATAWRKSLIN